MDTAKPRLVVDKEGFLGNSLLSIFDDSLLTIIVTKTVPETNRSILHIPFTKRIPKIPDNSFSEIFLVYNGEKELLEALPAFLKKAREEGARFYFITSIFHLPRGFAARLQKQYPEVFLLITGDIFSNTIHPSSPVSALLHEAKEYGHVMLYESGLHAVYPVALKDVIEAIQAIRSASVIEQRVFALYPKYPPTSITLTRILQKLYPLLQVDFSKKKKLHEKIEFPDNPLYVFGGNYPLEQRLKELDLTFTPLLPRQGQKKKIKRIRTKSQRRYIFLAISIFFFLFALPSMTTLGFATGGGFMLLQSQKAFESGKFEEARQAAFTGHTFFTIAKRSIETVKMSFGRVIGNDELLGLERTMENGEKVADILQNGAIAAASIQNVVQGSSPKPKEEFLEGSNKLKEALTLLQEMQVEGSIPQAYAKKLEPLKPMVTLMLNTIDTYPELLGFEQRKQYLVLFQNNFELRATGGFIGSYGLLTLEQGRVVSFVIQDVYETDGQLKEHVDPPFALRRYMGASHWYLRDSNYAIDFPTAAAQSAEFLRKVTKTKVDGVIAVDTTFLSSMLDVTGPIHLPDYKETITRDNFFLTTQKHVEEEFFPGSTQKRDYLRALHSAIEQKLDSNKLPYQKLLMLLAEGVDQKHVIVAFADQSIQRLYTVNNVSGSLWEGRVDNEQTATDFLSVNEMNIGLNKVNYYIKRGITQDVSIDGEGNVNEKVEIAYINTSDTSSPFGGEYKAYLRFVLPENAVMSGLLIDNVETPTTPAITDPARYTARNFIAPKEIEIETMQSNGHSVIGMYITVPTRSQKKYTLSYTLPERFPIESPESIYSHRIVKQPGTLNDSYRLTIRYPLSLQLFKSSSGVSNIGGKLIYESELDTDEDLQVTFIPSN